MTALCHDSASFWWSLVPGSVQELVGESLCGKRDRVAEPMNAAVPRPAGGRLVPVPSVVVVTASAATPLPRRGVSRDESTAHNGQHVAARAVPMETPLPPTFRLERTLSQLPMAPGLASSPLVATSKAFTVSAPSTIGRRRVDVSTLDGAWSRGMETPAVVNAREAMLPVRIVPVVASGAAATAPTATPTALAEVTMIPAVQKPAFVSRMLAAMNGANNDAVLTNQDDDSGLRHAPVKVDCTHIDGAAQSEPDFCAASKEDTPADGYSQYYDDRLLHVDTNTLRENVVDAFQPRIGAATQAACLLALQDVDVSDGLMDPVEQLTQRHERCLEDVEGDKHEFSEDNRQNGDNIDVTHELDAVNDESIFEIDDDAMLEAAAHAATQDYQNTEQEKAQAPVVSEVESDTGFTIATSKHAVKSTTETLATTSAPVEPATLSLGFSTASGKKSFEPTAEALAKARAMFGDDDTFEKVPPLSLGFSTASGKKAFEPSVEALAKARTMFGDDDIQPQPPTVSLGFSTASGKKAFEPSAEAPAKARAMSGDADTSDKVPPLSLGFSTASAKKAFEPSAEALGKARAMFGDDDAQPQPPTVSLGFSTASGKKAFEPTAEALAKARAMFDDDDTQPQLSTPSLGFSTASGKKAFEPSAEALAKAQAMFGNNDAQPQPPTVSLGFSTASGKKAFEPTAEALSKARAMFGDDDTQPQVPAVSFGFSTASGKKAFEPTPEALTKAHAMFDDGNQPKRHTNSLEFSTASGKKTFEPTAEALAKAHAMFDDGNQPRPHTVSLGFSTASGRKTFEPSAEATAKARAMFGDDDAQPKSHTLSLGFSTASGKKAFEPTAEALAKARAMLGDDDAQSRLPTVSLGFSTASGKKAFEPTAEALAKARTMFGDDDAQNVSATEEREPPITSGKRSFEHLSTGLTKQNGGLTNADIPAQREAANMSPPDQAFRVPLPKRSKSSPDVQEQENRRQTLNVLSHTSMTTEKERRSSLPNLAGKLKKQQPSQRSKKFQTPFKDSSLRMQQHGSALPSPSLNSSSPIKFNLKPLFDLNSAVPLRKPLSTLGILQRHSALGNGIDPIVRSITFSTAAAVTFSHGEINHWSAAHAYQDLIKAGANPKLIDERWTEHHFRLIVWKLASYARRFGQHEWWTRDTVFSQLSYRYQREINEGQRSIFKAVCERDDVPSRPMIILVCEVPTLPDNPTAEKPALVKVSDGWYVLDAELDATLWAAAKRGRLFAGQKLYIFGAQLVGSSEPHPPLEAGSAIRLKLCSNTTRRVRWDARLGLLPIDVVVLRKYPLCYSETKADGSWCMLSSKEEETARRQHENAIAKLYEKLIADKLKEHHEESKMDPTMEEMEQIRKDVVQEVEDTLPSRSVSSFLKLRVCDFRAGARRGNRNAVITIWRPDLSAVEGFIEGGRYRFEAINSGWFDNESNTIQLSTTRQTSWEKLDCTHEEASERGYAPRAWNMRCADLSNVAVGVEVDLVAVVLAQTDQFGFLVDESGTLVIVQLRQVSPPKQTLVTNTIVAIKSAHVHQPDQHLSLPVLGIDVTSEIISAPFPDALATERAAEIADWINGHPEEVTALRDFVQNDILHQQRG